MNYCKRCGNPVESQDVFCGECGAVLAVPSQEPRKSSPLPYSLDESGFIRATPPLPDTDEEQTEDIMPKEPALPDFELAEGERVIRTYHCCEFGQQRSDGILSVTNQRILFCANSDKDLCHQEMPLADWVGTDIFWGTQIAWNKACLGFALVLCGLASLFVGLEMIVSALLLFAAGLPGAILLYLSMCRRFALTLHSRYGFKIQIGTVAGVTTLSAPGENMEQLARELGSLLHDLQTQGDEAAAKWEMAPHI